MRKMTLAVLLSLLILVFLAGTTALGDGFVTAEGTEIPDRIQSYLKKEKLEGRLILQVHDELIVECPEKEADTVAKLLAEEMENVIHLSVPLSVEVKTGHTWHEAH